MPAGSKETVQRHRDSAALHVVDAQTRHAGLGEEKRQTYLAAKGVLTGGLELDTGGREHSVMIHDDIGSVGSVPARDVE